MAKEQLSFLSLKTIKGLVFSGNRLFSNAAGVFGFTHSIFMIPERSVNNENFTLRSPSFSFVSLLLSRKLGVPEKEKKKYLFG